MSIKRFMAAAVAVAAAIALPAASSPTAEAATKPKLLVSHDYPIPCRVLDRSDTVRVESVDFAFRVGRRVILQATDGFQFSVVVIGLNKNAPFACVPVAPVKVPASWADD